MKCEHILYFVKGVYPYSEDHYICIKCDSTFPDFIIEVINENN